MKSKLSGMCLRCGREFARKDRYCGRCGAVRKDMFPIKPISQRDVIGRALGLDSMACIYGPPSAFKKKKYRCTSCHHKWKEKYRFDERLYCVKCGGLGEVCEK